MHKFAILLLLFFIPTCSPHSSRDFEAGGIVVHEGMVTIQHHAAFQFRRGHEGGTHPDW
jgi:hypothetical protein